MSESGINEGEYYNDIPQEEPDMPELEQEDLVTLAPEKPKGKTKGKRNGKKQTAKMEKTKMIEEKDNNQPKFARERTVAGINLRTMEQLVKYDEDTGYPVKVYEDETVRFLINNLHLVTLEETKEIVYYKDGVYKKGGDDLARQMINQGFFGYRTEEDDMIIDRKVTEEIMTKVRYLTSRKMQDFDEDVRIINMKNGLFNWETGEFMSHTPDYLSLIQVPTIYDPDATCPTIVEVLREIIRPQDYIMVLEYIAYTLYRKMDIQTSLILYGAGSSGKSVFLDLLRDFVGHENCSNRSLQDLVHDKFAPADLYGKLLNECGDLDAETLRGTGMFKRLTGRDTITAQEKFKNPFNFVNFAKLVFATNIIPRTADRTTGFSRRVIVIAFLMKYTAENYNPERLQKIRTPEELSGLFNLVIPHLPKLLANHKFTNAPTVEDIERDYNAAANPVEAFANNYLVEEPVSYVSKDTLYNYYCDFCKKHLAKPVHRNTFNKEIVKYANFLKPGTRNNKQNQRIPVWLNVSCL